METAFPEVPRASQPSCSRGRHLAVKLLVHLQELCFVVNPLNMSSCYFSRAWPVS